MSNNKKLILGSLAMDLKRVALGLHRNSLASATTFREEALKRAEELEKEINDDYTNQLLIRSKRLLINLKPEFAEDLLMYSTLYQNLAQK